jgi:MFS family permease
VQRPVLSRRYAYGLIIYGMTVLVATGTVPLGLWTAYADEFDFSPAVITFLAASTVFGVIVAVILFGNLSDRIGRRAVLFPGVLLGALSMVLFIAADGVPALFAARVTSGLAVGLFTGAGTAALTELVPPGGDTRRAATHAATTSVAGFAMGPLIGGIFVQYGPWPLQLVYVVSLAFLVPLLVGVVLLPETVVNRRPFRIQPRRVAAPQEGRSTFGLASLIVGCCFAGASFFQSLGPTVAIVILGVSNQLLAACVAVCFLGASALVQIGLRGLPIRTATLSGLVLLPAGFTCVILALLTDSRALFVSGAIVGGLGQGLAYLGGQSLVEKVAPPAQRGEIFSLYMIVLYVSGSSVAITFGIIARQIGLEQASLMYVGFVVSVSLVALLVTLRSGLLRPRGTGARPTDPSSAPSPASP